MFHAEAEIGYFPIVPELQIEECLMQIDAVTIPDVREFFSPEVAVSLQMLCDTLVAYHNSPIIVYECSTPLQRKKNMLAMCEQSRVYLDRSKLRFNHIYSTRLLLSQVLSSLEGNTCQQATKLLEILLDLDECFYINGLDPDNYCNWNLDDQRVLARTINPHIRKALSRIEAVCSIEQAMV